MRCDARDFSIRGDAATQTRHELRAIERLGHVALARPDHLHWTTHVLRDERGLRGEIGNEASTKSTARKCRVHENVVLGCAERMRDECLNERRRLAWRPDFDLVA